MSSPFRYFRKHTKAFMAVAAVICMFLFVFASGTGGGSRSGDMRQATANVATWNGGSLNEGELASLVQQRLVTNDFLRMLFLQGGGSEYNMPTSVPMLLLQSDRPEYVEMEVINSEVFANLAEEAGISVGDDMINYYIKEWGQSRVDDQDILGMLAGAGEGNVRANEAIVFSTLRKLLLAYFYQRSYDDAARTVLPQQRWADWRRVNDRISVQAAVLPVENLVANVPEPTDAQLKALYNDFKDYDPKLFEMVGERELPSPNPGFAIPRRVGVQYLVGSVADRTKKLLDTITEEEIADYYERNKRRDFVKVSLDGVDFDADLPATDLPAAEDSDAASPDADAEGAETPAVDATSSTQLATDATPTEPPAADATTPADGEPPATEPATEPATGDEPTDAAPADATPTEPPATDPAANPQSKIRRTSPFQLTALQQPADNSEETPAADAANASAPAADAATTEEATSDNTAETADPSADAATEPAASDGPAATEPASTEPADAAESPAGGAVLAPGHAPVDPAAVPSAEPPVEYIPLADVRDEIRQTLAQDKAVVEIQRQMSEARAKLQSEYNIFGRKVIISRSRKTKAPKPPERLTNLDWLAQEYGLTFAKSEPLTARELYETPVGEAVDEQSGRISVARAVFTSLELFEPFLAVAPAGISGDRFLVMKSKDIARRIPEFDEVRDEVAIAWRRREAANRAEKKAKELAKASETADESFDEFFKEAGFDIVPQTALFSWRSYPAGVNPGYDQQPQLSDVPELPKVGPNFMEAAFGLADNKTAALLNHDHTAAIVIRLHSRQYSPSELKSVFLQEANTWMGNRELFNERFARVRQSVDSRLAELAGFKFDDAWEKRRLEQLAKRN